MSTSRTALFLFTLAASLAANADTPRDDVVYLQTRWAEIKYQSPENQQKSAFATLCAEATTLQAKHTNEAPFLIWQGIIHASYAGAKGGLGALGEVKKAKAFFETAIKLAPDAMAGSAYTSLGSLYYQVPGWPIGFGDDEAAEEMLKKGLSYNPDGIDSNFFYGDFLLEQDRYAEAKSAFEKALAAPARPGREVADSGRRQEIAAKLQEVQAEL